MLLRGVSMMVYVLVLLCSALLGSSLPCQASYADSRPRVILVGGFLGSGKTTLLRQAAKTLAQSGKRVGLVTNDQAPMLVDTRYLRDSELNVKEVAGGCFCCRFTEFAGILASFVRESAPNVVLGEPVGSCTDISATVLQPLKDRYAHRFTLAPFTVLLDPERADVALGEETASMLHPSARYIVRKQVEEADVIALNKIDLLSERRLAEILGKLRLDFPGAMVFAMSAKTGKGVDEWLNYVMTSSASGRTITDVNYDTYAEGEAVLGWLNCTAELKAGSAGNARDLCVGLMKSLQSALVKAKAEVAHLKMIVEDASGRVFKANLTSAAGTVSTEGESWPADAPLVITLNARVQIDPATLERITRKALSNAANGRLSVTELKSFSPSRPRPTYRYDKVQ